MTSIQAAVLPALCILCSCARLGPQGVHCLCAYTLLRPTSQPPFLEPWATELEEGRQLSVCQVRWEPRLLESQSGGNVGPLCLGVVVSGSQFLGPSEECGHGKGMCLPLYPGSPFTILVVEGGWQRGVYLILWRI